MKQYMVESRKDCTEIFDNYLGDYIEAESSEEAVSFYKEWLVENGCDPEEVEDWEYRITEKGITGGNMNAVKEDVELLVQKELESANKKFPMFHSDHEGYAVLKEEVEEAETDLMNIKDVLSVLWRYIKRNVEVPKKRQAELVKMCAIELAVEAIQVAAMAQKFIDSRREANKTT